MPLKIHLHCSHRCVREAGNRGVVIQGACQALGREGIPKERSHRDENILWRFLTSLLGRDDHSPGGRIAVRYRCVSRDRYANACCARERHRERNGFTQLLPDGRRKGGWAVTSGPHLEGTGSGRLLCD